MTDVLTKEQRSYNMSRIRNKWTKQEKVIHNYLKGRKIKHKMHPDIFGKPDILLRDSGTLIFLDGCFWHKCPKCFVEPKTNRDFWLPKIERNVRKDREVTKKLRSEGWKVIRIWEHEIRENLRGCLKKIESAANK
ncbi:MAG: very short patch repair endonuclease [Candidatus Aenigmatarchaeota archaeon]|nr:MAG: very short patch repair endonuclease [Candidatus Aenigmarchaeota archaeon]